MLKKYYILLLSIIVLSLSGCWSDPIIQNITFEKYILPLTIHTIFEKTPTTQITESPIKNKIITIYTKQKTPNDNTWETLQNYTYVDNIIILKDKNTYPTLESFVEKNATIKNKENFSSQEETTIKTEQCETIKEIYIHKGYLENKSKKVKEYNKIYCVQGLFLDENDAYIISYTTKEKNKYKKFYNNIKNITCESQSKTKIKK